MIVKELAPLDGMLAQWAAAKMRQGCTDTDIVIMLKEAVEIANKMKPPVAMDYLPRFNSRGM